MNTNRRTTSRPERRITERELAARGTHGVHAVPCDLHPSPPMSYHLHQLLFFWPISCSNRTAKNRDQQRDENRAIQSGQFLGAVPRKGSVNLHDTLRPCAAQTIKGLSTAGIVGEPKIISGNHYSIGHAGPRCAG